jgi:phosphate transport system protein
VPHELRLRFHQELEDIDAEVVRLFALVHDRIAAATDSLLAADTQAAREVTLGDIQVDQLERDLEATAERLLLLEQPMSRDMRYLLTVVRIVPQLERCGDLAEHVAQRTITGLGARLTPQIRQLLSDMGIRCVDLWQGVAAAWRVCDATATARLDHVDDELDLLHDDLTGEIIGAGREGALDTADIMQATLVGRFYERLGDHAVHIAQRIAYISPTPAP